VIVPNSELYTNPVIVNTAFQTRRWQYDIGIGYGDDIEHARAVILEELVAADDVLPDPKADVIVVALDPSTVNLRARWWTLVAHGRRSVGQDRVLTRIKKALTDNGIDLPFPTRQILFHDQTE
jgi:small conductance mechanosensitive channel